MSRRTERRKEAIDRFNAAIDRFTSDAPKERRCAIQKCCLILFANDRITSDCIAKMTELINLICDQI